MSTMSDRERAVRRKLKDDFEHYAPRCLRIRTKAGGVEPFSLNRSQRYLHERLEAQLKRIGRVRALVLKGRQVGISTYIGGRFYWKTTHRRGFRTFILTHQDQATDNLFEMVKRFHDHCPPLVKPATGYANAKELSFKALASGYKVSTAGSKGVGRSETVQLFHASEVAFWVRTQQQDAGGEDHFTGIMQAVPNADGTEVIMESTANGIGNDFYAKWKAAILGLSEFEAIFIPWFWHEEYRRTPPDGWHPPTEWLEYEELYQLDREQTYWAYVTSREMATTGKAGGDPEGVCWKFRQEYPANADEAFQTSGVGSFISAESVLRARKTHVEGYGPLILGVDPARGGGDKTGIVDRQGRRLGAHVAKRIDNRDLMATAGEIKHLARTLKPAKIVIDTTGLGAGLYDRLREMLGDLVEGVNFGARAYEHERFANRRAEIWDAMREWFNDPAGVQVPDNDEMQGDLCSVASPGTVKGGTRFNSSGQLVLEEKEHIRARLKFSPDLGDAAALTFAVDVAPDAVRDIDVAAGRMGGWLAS